jgi:hypothetical protein
LLLFHGTRDLRFISRLLDISMGADHSSCGPF